MDQARESQLTALSEQLTLGYAQLAWLAADEPNRSSERKPPE